MKNLTRVLGEEENADGDAVDAQFLVSCRTNTWEYQPVHPSKFATNADGRNIHPHQKPLKLIGDIINIHMRGPEEQGMTDSAKERIRFPDGFYSLADEVLSKQEYDELKRQRDAHRKEREKVEKEREKQTALVEKEASKRKEAEATKAAKQQEAEAAKAVKAAKQQEAEAVNAAKKQEAEAAAAAAAGPMHT
ncbi:hypothetical protein CYMTET_26638 [Cymbomonas tetramitiformis]|uniref:Uncharacterized protein n=1 Tax=Cymbomonas tetramitiformis TaxID=36881 RepID=A0AAE0FS40_9CHLO|nr:hypothetical protein CYMTET_26638 [Cymbomonas tetramitiformis]